MYQNAFLASRPSSPSPVPLQILHSCNCSLLSTWYKCCTQQMTSPLLKHLTHGPSRGSLHYWQTTTGQTVYGVGAQEDKSALDETFPTDDQTSQKTSKIHQKNSCLTVTHNLCASPSTLPVTRSPVFH